MSERQYAVWIDWNGTLVKHRKGDPVWTKDGEVVIGAAVTDMVQRVRRHMTKGRRFVLKSAMMSDADPKRRAKVEKALGDWSEKWLGKRLEVTATCRPEFIDQWDDKVTRVERNTGRFTHEQTAEESRDEGLGDDGEVRGASADRAGRSKSLARSRRGGGDTAEGRAAERYGEWGDWNSDD